MQEENSYVIAGRNVDNLIVKFCETINKHLDQGDFSKDLVDITKALAELIQARAM